MGQDELLFGILNSNFFKPVMQINIGYAIVFGIVNSIFLKPVMQIKIGYAIFFGITYFLVMQILNLFRPVPEMLKHAVWSRGSGLLLLLFSRAVV